MPKTIVFMGTPQYAVPTLERLANDERYKVLAVLTQADKAAGRGRQLMPSPVKIAALKYNIPCLQPEKLNTDEMYGTLLSLEPDLFVTIAYGKILRPRFLAIPKIAPLNLHASLLPKYRGAAPIAWSIYNGETSTGVSLMKMDEGMDTGPVYAMRSTTIKDSDTAESLHDILSQISAEILIEHLPDIISGKLLASPQLGTPSLAPPLEKSFGQINFFQSAKQVSQHIRALYPWPRAFTTLRNKRLNLEDVFHSEENSHELAGTFLGYDDKRKAMLISCKEGILGVRSLKVEGKSSMDAKSFLNGYRLQIGDSITDV